MFKEDKYFGEVWLKESLDDRCFCNLELIDDEVYITTNLTKKYIGYQIDIIYGVFNGLGYLTFVNCNVQKGSDGMVRIKTFKPQYTFSSEEHLIDPINLKSTEFKIDNQAIVHWVRKMHWFDPVKNVFKKVEDINLTVDISADLSLNIIKSTSQTTNKDFFRMDNVGYVHFKSGSSLNILDCIYLYDLFQKLLHFVYGKSLQFNSFNFKCLGCGSWVSLYYKSNFSKENISSFITLDYDTIKNDLPNLIRYWFTNKNISYCSDIIIENLLSVKTSHSRRFTNSYSAFEAYSHQFGENYKNPSVAKFLLEHKKLINRITAIPENEIKTYISKIIRHRDFLIHRNKIKNELFSNLELLYISFLLDFIVGIGLMRQMNVSNPVVEKIITRATSNYHHMQLVNKILGKDILKPKE